MESHLSFNLYFSLIFFISLYCEIFYTYKMYVICKQVLKVNNHIKACVVEEIDYLPISLKPPLSLPSKRQNEHQLENKWSGLFGVPKDMLYDFPEITVASNVLCGSKGSYVQRQGYVDPRGYYVQGYAMNPQSSLSDAVRNRIIWGSQSSTNSKYLNKQAKHSVLELCGSLTQLCGFTGIQCQVLNTPRNIDLFPLCSASLLPPSMPNVTLAVVLKGIHLDSCQEPRNA